MIKKFGFYLFAVAVFFAGQFLRSGDLVTGKPPQIQQTTLGGIASMSLLQNGPTLIYFWADWCGICGMMKGSITAIAADYPVLTLAYRSGEAESIKKYLQAKQLPWQVVNDPNGDIADQYGVKAVPALFILNEAGNIVFTSVGYTSEWGLRIRLWLASFV